MFECERREVRIKQKVTTNSSRDKNGSFRIQTHFPIEIMLTDEEVKTLPCGDECWGLLQKSRARQSEEGKNSATIALKWTWAPFFLMLQQDTGEVAGRQIPKIEGEVKGQLRFRAVEGVPSLDFSIKATVSDNEGGYLDAMTNSDSVACTLTRSFGPLFDEDEEDEDAELPAGTQLRDQDGRVVEVIGRHQRYKTAYQAKVIQLPSGRAPRSERTIKVAEKDIGDRFNVLGRAMP